MCSSVLIWTVGALTIYSSALSKFEADVGRKELAITKSAICEPKMRLMCLCSKICLKYLEILLPERTLAMVFRLGRSLSASSKPPRRFIKAISRRIPPGKLVDIFTRIVPFSRNEQFYEQCRVLSSLC